MTTQAEEQFHGPQHEKDRAVVADSWTQALRNELGMLEGHAKAGREGPEFADLERRIGEVKALLGVGRKGRQTAVVHAQGAQER